MFSPKLTSFKLINSKYFLNKLEKKVHTKRFSDASSKYGNQNRNNQFMDRNRNVEAKESFNNRYSEKIVPSRPKGDFYYKNKNYQEESEEKEVDQFDGDNIYGIAPVRIAIAAGRRNITELVIQSGMDLANKKDERSATEILKIAKEIGVKIRELPKHELNMMSDNRPHQGFVLRADPLEYEQLTELEATSEYKCVLALDEVWDPQNFGALLRTAFFLGCHKVVVCAKNSAPLSPTVSKASSGALEVMKVYSVNNMMKFLDKSHENGWQIIGTDLNEKSININDVPLKLPTILILGNEGHGIRTNLIRKCDHLIKISSSNKVVKNKENIEIKKDYDASLFAMVDSLNVSVTGGIILHHFLKNHGEQSLAE